MSTMLTSHVEETFSYDKRVHLYRIERYSGEIYKRKDKIFEREKQNCLYLFWNFAERIFLFCIINIRMKSSVLDRILKFCFARKEFFFLLIFEWEKWNYLYLVSNFKNFAKREYFYFVSLILEWEEWNQLYLTELEKFKLRMKLFV